tara:strand:- start:778 stop:999 length:222 start_codon:yes stop_codon:yes gene_type:complete
MQFPIVLKKKNARVKIVFDIDEEMSDPWFIKMSRRWIKSDKEVRSNTIVKKDVDGYLSMLINEGYEIQDTDET